MEDSICKVPHRDGCGMPYIMDAELGVVGGRRRRVCVWWVKGGLCVMGSG